MGSQYGVNTLISANASRPIVIESSTAIFICGSVVLAGLSEDLRKLMADNQSIVYFSNTAKAVESFASSAGTIRGVLDGINDHVSTPIIISVFAITDAQSKKTAELFYSDNKIKSEVIKSIGKARTAMAIFGIQPNLLIAPRFTHDLDVKAEIQAVATVLSATAIVDLNSKNESDSIKKVEKYSSKRLLITDPYVKVWDTKTNSAITEPMSGRVAGMIAYSDGLKEYGWSQSASNRVMQGISGLARPIEFIAGQDCEADRLRSKGIATVINYKGLRLWGFETTDIDSIWKSLERVRTFDKISDATLEGLFFAIDRGVDVLIHAKNSLDGLLLSLKGAMVLVGYDVFWHDSKNTKEALTAGKFYLVAEMQNMGTTKRLEIECSFVDRYSPVIMKIIGG